MPKTAIVAITLNCNSRCIMCDIWKNKIPNELPPEEYLKLPSSLVDINITGGEPFLRSDLVEIIKNMKKAAPRARLALITNGFMPHRVRENIVKLRRVDPSIAFRVSLDGIGKIHDTIRGIPGGYKKVMETLAHARLAGIQDIGISFTLLRQNVKELPKVQEFCNKNNYEFAITIATSSSIYFGAGKETLRPKDDTIIETTLSRAARNHMQHFNPKQLIRGWFISRMITYLQSGKRPLPCDAGKGFFYMDSLGNVFTCHIKPWKMGNITKQSFSQIMQNQQYENRVASCNDCWMTCTAKSIMMKKWFRVAIESLIEKTRNK